MTEQEKRNHADEISGLSRVGTLKPRTVTVEETPLHFLITVDQGPGGDEGGTFCATDLRFALADIADRMQFVPNEERRISVRPVEFLGRVGS